MDNSLTIYNVNCRNSRAQMQGGVININNHKKLYKFPVFKLGHLSHIEEQFKNQKFIV